MSILRLRGIVQAGKCRASRQTFESVLSKALRIAALQYCAGADAGATSQTQPMIARAAEAGADLVALPEAASFLAPSRESLAELAEK